MEQSIERDSRWKPHLSWSFLSWNSQQQEQAAQRELAWQRLTNKLNPILISDGGGYKCFVATEYKPAARLTPARGSEHSHRQPGNNDDDFNHNNELVDDYKDQQESLNNSELNNQQEKLSLLKQQKILQQQQRQKLKSKLLKEHLKNHHCIVETNNLLGQEYQNDPDMYLNESYKRARRRCVTVSTVLILLTLLLFVIVILMALGILHR